MCYVGRQAMKIYEYLIMTEYIGRDGIANICTYIPNIVVD